MSIVIKVCFYKWIIRLNCARNFSEIKPDSLSTFASINLVKLSVIKANLGVQKILGKNSLLLLFLHFFD